MNRDLMVISVARKTTKKHAKKIKSMFQEEYPNYFIVVLGVLDDWGYKVEITKIN